MYAPLAGTRKGTRKGCPYTEPGPQPCRGTPCGCSVGGGCRRGIGAITITVVTQETWSNQEAGAVAPEQATVRVTSTLRWDAGMGRWLMVASEQMGV
ncbi:hypothetical protein A9Q02_13070 [Candidatus Chloroploca asiatica]|uniref:Uncharacterized protein n=1 Tax=Candidatus Chloroploca asiatica TaxID=1506545 RepID=A0A2H3KMD6_9CHLR|nr:hypothetical protein A9Q02_13070 [Candidatus Chloroploca asiatica]